MRQTANRGLQRGADFLAGVLAEPLLAFGGSYEHVDPKTGLALYGPYCPPGLTRPTLSNMIIGAVGPAAMVADAAAWIDACRGIITNSGAEPFLYPHFPGCRQDQLPFYCDLLFREQWCETIRDVELKRALALPIFEDRLMAVINLYLAGVETLKGREPQPDVVLLCLPQEVVDRCAVAAAGDQHVPVIRRAAPKLAAPGARQLEFMFAEPEAEDEGELVHRNLRRGLKAQAMRHGIPTQIVWPRTLRLTADDGGGRGSRKSQDPATRAWNVITALYHKAGGIPWRLRHIDPGVCFVGVSFYRELHGPTPRLRTSMAQTFTASGDGYVLRGATFDWNEREHGNSPHLDFAASQSLVRDVLERYKRQNRGSLPTRLVVHKRSRFWKDELERFSERRGAGAAGRPRRARRARYPFFPAGRFPAAAGHLHQIQRPKFPALHDRVCTVPTDLSRRAHPAAGGSA